MGNAASFGFAVPAGVAFRGDTLQVDDLVAFVQRGEELGYREGVIPDHILVPANWAMLIGDTFVDPFTLIGYLAAQTKRLRLVLGCAVVPYRPPLAVAKAMATLDQLSRGRVALGVVPGYLQGEFEALGVPFDERIAMTEEFVEVMRTAWTDEHATFHGRFHSFDDWNLKPKCVQQPHVPIWVGGASKGALRRAVTFGDVWHPLGLVVNNEEFMSVHGDQFEGETKQTDSMTPARIAAFLRDAADVADRVGRDLSTLEQYATEVMPAFT